MIYRKHELRALGLCFLAALGVMAFTASVTQAEAGDSWDIEGKSLSLLPESKESIGSESDNFTYSLTLIPALGAELHCQKMVLDEGRIITNVTEGAVGHGTLLFTECTVLPETCKVAEPIVSKVKALLILHEETGFGKKTYVLFSPLEAGQPIVTFKFSGEFCILPKEAQITGSVVAACLAGAEPAGLCETSRVKHLIETNATINALFAGQTEGGKALPKDGLSFGVNAATFTSRTVLFLNGLDKGRLWAGLAETEGSWDIEGKSLSLLPESKESIGSLADQFTYLAAISKIGTEIHCGGMALTEGSIIEGGTGHGTLSFSECKVLPETCVVLEPIVPKVKALLILHEETGFGKKTYILFSPLTAGQPFVTLHFVGAECILPLEVGITGSVVAACLAGKEPAGLCETSQIKHLIETNATINALFAGQTEGGKALPKDTLFFGAIPMTFTSRTLLLLSGGDVGKPWAGLAP